MKILIINGPNLNFLGIREPNIYQNASYHDLLKCLNKFAKEHQQKIIIKQTNYEGKIIDYLQNAYYKKFDGIIINPGGYTHYSIAIRDAISSIKIPTVEVHLTDITKRESFRQISIITEVCEKTFMGKHFESYLDALSYFYFKESHHE